MLYISVANPGAGLTNQIYGLVSGIMKNLYSNNRKSAGFIDGFLNSYLDKNITPISHIINMDKLNTFIFSTYGLMLFDKHTCVFELKSVTNGSEDITDYINKYFYTPGRLYIPKNTVFPSGDTNLCINYNIIRTVKSSSSHVNIIYNFSENLDIMSKDTDICFDIINSKYTYDFWRPDFDFWFPDLCGSSNNAFPIIYNNILKNIEYTDDFINKSQSITSHIPQDAQVNVIHLRVEEDAINSWALVHKIDPDKFKAFLEYKYINIIQKYFSKDDFIILLSASLTNGVIDYLSINNYNYISTEKFFNAREYNAIVDLLTSKRCNKYLVSAKGSTFSYYISKIVPENVTNIEIDLDNIYCDEKIIGPARAKIDQSAPYREVPQCSQEL